MRQTIFFPFYHIYSDLVRTALGLKDSRSVERFFKEAGIKIYEIGNRKCVVCEDLLSVTKPKPVIFRYEGKSEISRKLDEMFPD